MNNINELIINTINSPVFIRVCEILIQNVIAYTTANALAKKHFFNRAKKVKDISYVYLPPEIKKTIESVNTDHIRDEFKDSVLRFTDVLKKNFEEKDIILFLNNLNNVNIVSNHKKHVFGDNSKIVGTAATYDTRKNSIVIINKNSKNAIFHELFHMSSTKKENGVIYCGFSQTDNIKHINIGDGLNEGYTELLASRYFYKDDDGVSYPYLVYVSMLLELIVGKDKMEKMYMNASLYDLIDELKKYAYYEDIMKFINDLDFIKEYLVKIKKGKSVNKELEDSFKRINYFLINSYIESFKYNKSYKYTDINKLLADIIAFKKRLIKTFNYDNKVYDMDIFQDENNKQSISEHIYEVNKYLEDDVKTL